MLHDCMIIKQDELVVLPLIASHTWYCKNKAASVLKNTNSFKCYERSCSIYANVLAYFGICLHFLRSIGHLG